ncbi:MAG: iron-containing alcohol dehydrogenase [Candidatus Odinarchaeota archaeon]
MRNFNYYQPTRIIFGWSRVNEIGNVVARIGKKCLMVSVKPFPAMQNLFEKVKKLCTDTGIDVIHYDEVYPNPTNKCVNIGSEIAANNKVDVILGVGGGSTIDTAKAIAVGATHKGDVWEYRLGQKRIESNKVLPIIAVPTTAGTGSEVTNMAVIKNPDEKFKSALADRTLNPTVSIIDPELTLTVPPYITASTGFDAFCHSFETFINKNASDFIDLYALDSIKKVIKYLPIAIKDGSNKEAREALSYAATLGGLSITNIGTTLPHGIGMAIGGHVPTIMHGESLAIMYPEINRWTWKYAVSKYATIARLFNPNLNNKPDDVAAEKACDEIDLFLKKIGLWISLEDKNIPLSELKAIANDSLKLRNYSLHPKIPNLEEVNDLIKNSYKRKD